ncbi:hypothetical protein JCM11251_002763 [Rhodosporidiobolus azoricus]
MELVASTSGPLTTTAPKPNKATARSVPQFLNKLYSMVSDPGTDDLIYWSDDGDSFFITSADRVAKELLPRFFKHSNFGSFVRQLNMYGFHKVPHLQQGVLKKDTNEETDLLEFSNPNFARAQPDLLCLIRRQKAKPGGEGAAAGENGALDIPSLLTDLAAIRKHQTAISADLKDLQERNNALWQEAIASREKHKKQEETINKILRFLAGVFGGQVLDAGQGAAGQVSGGGSPVVGPSGSSSSSVGGGGKGKTAGKGVVVMPKRRGTLLLEDVKGRQAERAAALRELDGDEDEEIEEIPLLDEEDEEDLPTISSSYIAPAPTTSSALSRPPITSSALTSYSSSSSSSNRFTAIPTPSPHPSPSPYANLSSSQLGNLSQDTINVLMQAAGNNPEALASFFSQQQQGNIAASNAALSTALSQPSSGPGGYNSLVPASSSSSFPSYTNPVPTLTTTSQPLDLSLFNPASAPSLSPSLTSELAQNNLAISSLNSESSDIQSRTAALEAQISHLMNSLPDEAREQVENATPFSEGAGHSAELDGFDWGTVTGPNGELDLDKMLAQFTDSSATNVSTTPNQFSSALPSIPASASTGANDPVDFSAFLADPSNSFSASPLDPALAALAAPYATTPAPQQSAYEVTSPDFGSDLLNGMGSPASTVGSTAEEVAGTAGKKKPAVPGGKKRKSDVLGGSPAADAGQDAASPAASESGAGTRRSARKRKV